MTREGRTALLVACLGAAVFLPSVWVGQFLHYDDDHYVVHSPAVAGFELGRALDPRADRSDLGAEYLPVRDVTYMIDARLWGLSPRAFRATNLLLHAVACGLAYLLLLETTRKPALALLAAAIFAVHPVHAESVAWIASRKDVLSGALGLGALLAHARGRLGWGLVLAVLAILSKSTLLCLPLLVPLVEKRLSWRVLPYFGMAGTLAANAVAVGTRTGIAHPLPPGGLATVIFTDAPILVRYVAESVWPAGLRVSYATFPLETQLDGRVLASVGALAAVVAGLNLVPSKDVRWGALWFAFALAPVLNLKPGVQWIADRYLYVPSLGAAVIVAATLLRVGARLRPLGVFLALATIAGFGGVALRHGLEFANDETLFRANLELEPENPVAHHQLARGLLARADEEHDQAASLARAAAFEEREALRIFVRPGVIEAGSAIEARHGLALALELQGDLLGALSTERQTLVAELVLAPEGERPRIRERAYQLGARVHPFQRGPEDAALIVEAARCFAFAHQDDLALHAAKRAEKTAPALVAQAVQEDPDLARAYLR